MTINLNVPDIRELKPRITVIGVGGAGGNAVSNMIRSNLEGAALAEAEFLSGIRGVRVAVEVSKRDDRGKAPAGVDIMRRT